MADKILFASDFHLGLPSLSDPLEREKRVVRWLKFAASEAKEIYLLGDIFDFWWEYRKVIPKGFTRFLGTLSEITDSGMPVHFFTGNHDMWTWGYLTTECGVTVHTGPLVKEFDGKTFYLAHGEGLGSDSKAYRMLLSIFRNKPLRKLYSSLHPSIGVGIGHRWSLNSRLGKGLHLGFLGEDKEDLFRHSRKILTEKNIDFFIYGHRHLPLSYNLKEGAVITILGDWINEGSYAVWDGKELILRNFI